ncbi:glycosyltransferase [Spirosoma sp. RP8]|uniref:Glycosyltransferase n=1 Tax=Spirosoma liriopis TaxID=2937440 RepID=A0ABT0HVS5_9BACT|nr:glycosyltransferase [Spirosoma liriopis]MCK8496075.1 glycosyltransferase [Spirosoma liriopis]
MNKGISVIMPTYNQASFIRRAIESLLNQTHNEWELIIINDGSTDSTESLIKNHLANIKIRYYKHEKNKGLGACLNKGIDLAKYDLIAYLPSDDLFFSNHLEILYKTILDKQAYAACSGIKYNYTETFHYSGGAKTLGKPRDFSIQLVQILHKKIDQRWVERDELVTANLRFMFWDKLASYGSIVETNYVTAEWVNHPLQRHKIISELFGGGLTTYKQYYGVLDPICFLGSGNLIDEKFTSSILKEDMTKNLNDGLSTNTPHPLKILIVGELGFNPERFLLFEKLGHKLFGLWIQASGFLCSVGPFPYGNIETLTSMDEIHSVKPDIIYALLNYSAVNLAYSVQSKFPYIPFVWHFKESPFICRQNGSWDKLTELYSRADGRIYINERMKQWFEQFLLPKESLFYILDGDLPNAVWLEEEKTTLLSDSDGDIHTVICGRPYGIDSDHIATLAKQHIHVHIYGNYQQNTWSRWIQEAKIYSNGYLHLHNNCDPIDWVSEFSKYDAGWMHIYECDNYNELIRVSWNELNIPARVPTMLAAGLPLIVKSNHGHISYTNELVEKFDIGVSFDDYEQLGVLLRNKSYMSKVRINAWNVRKFFFFDQYVNDLVLFFHEVIMSKSKLI